MLVKAHRFIRTHGWQSFVKRLACEGAEVVHGLVEGSRQEELLRRIARSEEPFGPVVFLPMMDWDGPMLQRPQQIALGLGKEGHLYFFVTSNGLRCHLGLRQVGENCHVTHDFSLLRRHFPNMTMHLCSNTTPPYMEMAAAHLERGGRVLYEYIDEIHEDLTGRPIGGDVLELHRGFLRDSRVMVVATAGSLWEEVLLERGTEKRAALVPNGADVEHFGQAERDTSSVPELLPALKRGGPVLGYYGALASWLDYELILHLAAARPDCEIVLMGQDYDGSLRRSGLERVANVHVLGPVAYSRLPAFAAWFDVALIPFVLNEITKSTSPIKLYEYMAAGLPVVSTNLPECQKHALVRVAKSAKDFVAHVDAALTLGHDLELRQKLVLEARRNSWQARARAISGILRQKI